MKKINTYTNYIIILSTIAGGFLNGYSYLLKGKVFATMQTGNLILATLHFLDANYIIAINYFIPIIFFMMGNYIGLYIKQDQKKIQINIIILILIALLTANSLNIITNILIAIVSGIQIQTFKTLSNISFATTMCTGNISKLAQSLYHQNSKNALLYFMIILSFVFGVVLASVTTKLFNHYAIFIVVITSIINMLLIAKNTN